jgi:hypothetical protein
MQTAAIQTQREKNARSRQTTCQNIPSHLLGEPSASRTPTAIKPAKASTRNVAIKRQGTISERSGGGRPHFALTLSTFTPRSRPQTKPVSQEGPSTVINPAQKATIAALWHVHSRKPAFGRMPNAACGTQALPGKKFLCPQILKSCQKHCKNPCQSVFIRGFISDSSTIVCQKNTLI